MSKESGIIDKTFIKECFDYIEKHKIVISSVSVCLLPVLTNIYYFGEYSFNCGYFAYFGMDDSYFLNTEKNSVMYFANCILIFALMFAYFYTAIELLKRPGAIVGKIVYCVALPIIVEGICLISIGVSFYTVEFWQAVAVLYTLYIFLLVGMAWNSLQEICSSFKLKWCNKFEKQTVNHLFIYKVFVLVFVVFVMGLWIRYIGYDFARHQTNFGIVTVDNNTYAVIKSDGNNMVLKKCEVNDNVLIIYMNSYLKEKNDKEVTITTFQNIVFK